MNFIIAYLPHSLFLKARREWKIELFVASSVEYFPDKNLKTFKFYLNESTMLELPFKQRHYFKLAKVCFQTELFPIVIHLVVYFQELRSYDNGLAV